MGTALSAGSLLLLSLVGHAADGVRLLARSVIKHKQGHDCLFTPHLPKHSSSCTTALTVTYVCTGVFRRGWARTQRKQYQRLPSMLVRCHTHGYYGNLYDANRTVRSAEVACDHGKPGDNATSVYRVRYQASATWLGIETAPSRHVCTSVRDCQKELCRA